MTQRIKWRQVFGFRRERDTNRTWACLLTLLLCSSPEAAVASRQVFGASPSLAPRSIQQSPDTRSADDGEKNVQSLELDKPVRRDLAGGGLHVYSIRLNADQFLRVIVEQQGIDVVVQVAGADEKPIAHFNAESRPRGQEEALLVAEEAGSFLLTVRPGYKSAPAGSYEIRIDELRVATDTDRALHQARKLFYEAIRLEDAGKYDEALRLYERALECRERFLGAEHCDVAASIDGLAGVYARKGEYARSETLNRRALAIREKTLGEDHPETAQSVTNLGSIFYSQGKYVEAEPLFKRALDIRERALGRDHPSTGVSFTNLGALYTAQGKYEEAEPLYKRDVDISEKALGIGHPETATSLNNLATLCYYQGKYKEAESLYTRALAIREKALGKNHPDLAVSLNSLALLYTLMARYAEAEALYTRASDIREKTLGKNHPDLATSLNNLAELYNKQGKYREAESLHTRALEIREKSVGKDHPSIANSLHNLAALYRRQGKDAEAESLFKRALEIREKSLGKNHPLTGASLNSLAELYNKQRKYREAESLHARALEIREKALGKNHWLTANSFHNLGLLYRLQGRYEEAEQFFKRALAVWEKALGKDHPDTVACLNNLAMLYIAKGDRVQAVKFQSLANTASERNLAYNLVTGSERDKLAYLATLTEQTDRTISLHLRYAPNDPLARDMAATLILQRKGRALDATSQNLNALRSRFNAEDQALLDRLTETRSQIARLVLGGPQRMSAERHQARIKELEEQAEKEEADISRRSDELRARFLPVTLESARAAIPPDSALIEFVSYRPFNARAAKGSETYGQPRYAAYVLRRDGEIKYKELGDAKTIDNSIASLRMALRDPTRQDVNRLARAVDATVFQPIRRLIGVKSRLLISPDGSLNLIPFAALVDESGRYAVERYSISYLTSGRDLMRFRVSVDSKNGPLIVAAPDFGSADQVAAPRSEKHGKAPSVKEIEGKSARSAIRELYFPPLPYAELEGDALRALLPGGTLLTKREATKAALSQVHGPKLLHIATHGFFMEDQRPNSTGDRAYLSFSDDPERFLNRLERNGLTIESPLLRSGLALAGANEHREDDNGILTALEVTGLNLWGTKLVTLSACDTGVGEVKNGDGVHGLRRALALAGAETQLMSLWAVSDRATRELMVSYYSGLKRGQGRGDALRLVQLKMLKKPRWRHPYYWASFIQSGAWASLASLDGYR